MLQQDQRKLIKRLSLLRTSFLRGICCAGDSVNAYLRRSRFVIEWQISNKQSAFILSFLFLWRCSNAGKTSCYKFLWSSKQASAPARSAHLGGRCSRKITCILLVGRTQSNKKGLGTGKSKTFLCVKSSVFQHARPIQGGHSGLNPIITTNDIRSR